TPRRQGMMEPELVGHLTYTYLKQLPILPPSTYSQPCPWCPEDTLAAWLRPRVLELTCTARDLAPFARDLGWDGPPFRWDAARRFLLRAELDAAFFHLYGLPRDDVDYVMETFPIVRSRDVKAHGTFRTKEAILDRYDALQRAMDTGVAYRTVLDPPPADQAVAHPPRALARPPGVLPDLGTLAPGAWARPGTDPRAETGLALAAVLERLSGPTPSLRVRLATLLVLDPSLLNPWLSEGEAAALRRATGSVPTPAEPILPSAWARVLSHLRASGCLVEDPEAGTWAPGAGLATLPTEGWPDGRAAFVWHQVARLGVARLLDGLPDATRRSLDEAAA
ncbi:MAG: hypothetical protein ABIO70_34655, partial [Pseudomonadota bacterium]